MKSLISFIKSTETYMEIYDEYAEEIMLNTRANGCVGSEKVGKKDVAEARRVVKLIKKKFPKLVVGVEEVDEWVHINICEKKPDRFCYSFIKRDDKGCGFTKGFNTIDELIKKYGSWVDVNWQKTRKEVESINEFPHNKFTEWHESKEILISKATENNWGYNFYISKSIYK